MSVACQPEKKSKAEDMELGISSTYLLWAVVVTLVLPCSREGLGPDGVRRAFCQHFYSIEHQCLRAASEGDGSNGHIQKGLVRARPQRQKLSDLTSFPV